MDLDQVTLPAPGLHDSVDFRTRAGFLVDPARQPDLPVPGR